MCETNDQAQALRKMGNIAAQNLSADVEHNPRVISVTSGKGGVGKTSVVSSLAVTWAKQGGRALIIDADLGLANIDVVFGLSPKYTLNHFFAGKRTLEEIMIEGPFGIKILPAGSGVQRFTNINPAAHMHFTEELNSLNNRFDLILIDTGAGISENVTNFSISAQNILVVTTPQLTAITDAYALVKVLALRYHENSFNLLVNSAQNETEALQVYEKLTMVANRFLGASIAYTGWLPYEKQFNHALSQQKAFVDLYPKSKFNAGCQKIIASLQHNSKTEPKKSIENHFWRKLLGLRAGKKI